MLIILSHGIVSYLLYRQNPSRFLTTNVSNDSGNSDRENEEESRIYQLHASLLAFISLYTTKVELPVVVIGHNKDLTLQLLQCCDVESLGSAVRNGLESYIPEAYGGALFYVDESNGDVITADNAGLTVCCPAPLCVKQAYGEKQQIILNVETAPACVLEQVTNNNGRSFSNQTKVLCSPVQKGQTSTVSAVLVIAACYSHIQRTFQGRAAEERASQQLIKLCGELYDQDAAQLQLKVLKYLEDQTQAECAFLLLVVPETQELFCQVIGKRILEEEIRFPGQSSSFSVALETKQPLNLDDIPVENRKGIEEVIEIPLRSFLCVPVTSRNDDNLIALACLVNKQNGNRFSERDVTCIRQCFRYTATVLTSTLAFQNERKIKIQTQALLQVAKHLFTNLGELVVRENPRIDNFPYIRSREVEVNVLGSNLIEAIEKDKLNKKYCRSTRYLSHMYCEKFALDQKLNLLLDHGSLNYSSPNKVCKSTNVSSVSLTKHQPTVENHKVKDENDIERSIWFCNDVENDREADCQYTQKISEEDELKGSKRTLVKISNKTSEIGNKRTVFVDKLREQTDDGQDIQPSTPVIILDDTDLVTNNTSPLQNLTLDKHDKTFQFLKQGEDFDDDKSDYASVYTHESDNLWNSLYGPDEVDSFLSCITSTDFDSNFEDTADASLKVHCDTDITDPSIDNETALLDVFGQSKSEDPRQRKSLIDTEAPEEFHLGNVRLSSSDPCIHESPVLCDSRPDLNNAFISERAEWEHIRNEKSRLIHKDVKTKQSEQQSNMADSPPILITLDKVDISDIQAPSTDLMSITENDLTKLLREVMAQARNLTQAERCSVFLIDDETDELVAKVFDGISTTKDNEVLEEIRLPSTQGIAGHVATSGELLNIKDAYSHPLFYRGIDDSTGFRTRNILCFPIKNDAGKIMGVAQLCNKKTGPFFTQFDEDLATAFGIYCCISISHSLLYKKVIDSQVRNSLANELMMYHMKSLLYKRMQDSQHRKSLANELMIYHMQVSPEDVTGLTYVDIPHPRLLHPDFVEFSYAPRTLPETKTLLACLSMFEDLNLISRWRIKRESLARFILMVKKGYRNPPYHNWMHAYTVAQFCYQLVKNMNLTEYLDEIEIFAIFVSCLCHDIDHRGTNNSFQTASKSVLAALYSSEGSVLERHHFAQTMCILNTEGCNIFEHLTSKEYQQVLDLIRDIILATDLAHHLKILKTLREMSVRGYDKNQIKDRKLLLCLLMTSCDLSDQTKPWDNTKNVAALIYKEFFTQGDLEKASGFQPAEMFDRERAQIPEVQIGFLDHIALPVYKVLSDIFQEGKEICEAVENNKRHWEKIRNLIKLRRGGSCARMTFDEVIAIENEADDVEMGGSSEQLNHSVSNGSG